MDTTRLPNANAPTQGGRWRRSYGRARSIAQLVLRRFTPSHSKFTTAVRFASLPPLCREAVVRSNCRSTGHRERISRWPHCLRSRRSEVRILSGAPMSGARTPTPRCGVGCSRQDSALRLRSASRTSPQQGRILSGAPVTRPIRIGYRRDLQSRRERVSVRVHWVCAPFRRVPAILPRWDLNRDCAVACWSPPRRKVPSDALATMNAAALIVRLPTRPPRGWGSEARSRRTCQALSLSARGVDP